MQLFLELLRASLETAEASLSRVPSDKEWNSIFTVAKKQAVEGVMLSGVERLPLDQKPPQTLLLEWIGTVEIMKQHNLLMNNHTAEVTKLFSDAGFRSCILKGQGNAELYPNPLARHPGDIDIWVEGDRKDIKRFVMSRFPNAQDGHLHIDFPCFQDTVVEVHYKPHYSSIPKYNRRLQAWFKEQAKKQFTNQTILTGCEPHCICAPTALFNAVHQMSHIKVHFFVEGIGLRQIVDYFYVLKHLHDEEVTEDFGQLFRHLGMAQFARGVMWMEKNVLGLDETYLLVESDEKVGKTIFEEIVKGGNFGQYDERYTARHRGLLARGMVDTYRLLKLSSLFPSESWWKILRKVENQKWKIKPLLLRNSTGGETEALQ